MGSDNYIGLKGEAFFAQRQAAAGDRVQALRATLFDGISSPSDRLIDFGCGTGGILIRLPAYRRVGIELGTTAAEEARRAGVEVFSSLDALADASFDVAISFHALEHVDSPLEVMQHIGRLVAPGGRIRLVVPCETPISAEHRRWRPNNYLHLHTWTPLVFGNLADRAGYREIQSRLVPMPSGSRLTRLLRGMPPAHRMSLLLRSVHKNNLNVVLDARPPRRD